MNLYLTGSDNREDLLDIATRLKAKGHRVTTPYDVVDDQWKENENLLVRLQAVLANESVVTTPPNQGAWGEGADREVKVARAANIPVQPVLHFLPTEQN